MKSRGRHSRRILACVLPLALLVVLVVPGCYSIVRQTADVESGDSIKREMVAAHNYWRRAVGVPPLSWSEDLADEARRWAGSLRGRSCAMIHEPDSDYGENLYWSQGARATPEQVVQSWASERRYYSYERNACAPGEVCGHYTQIVWESTRRLGCAVARCGNREVWVCKYDPPGNWVGERPY